ncbi:MAG: quinone-interacting membrane-bound oxidoreductase complex subunit QmoC [Bacteroidales bacterium]|nr:quinone-interacting membrane-bound oxidoreductase complex subunit QmoC [Bacteroidales bacterium]
MLRIKPDIRFKKEITRISGSPLGECIQCGNCSAVCSLAPEDRPFPRKEMAWAAWGLKDKLMGNPDIWLCHQCGDCSTYCPRGVRPSDVLAAVRKITIQHYARPGFMGKLLSSPAYLPVAIAIPVVIISVILMMAGTFRIPEGPVNYSKFFPHIWLNTTFTAMTLFFYGMAFIGLRKFWKDMKRIIPAGGRKSTLFKSILQVLKEVFGHSKFSGCKSNKSRNLAHLLTFFGFVLLLLVTLYAIVASITHHYPLSFTNPFKILGNIASLMLYTGITIMIARRLFDRGNAGRSNYDDWLLLISILLLTASGTLVEAARFLEWGWAYHLYFFHLVCVWFLIMYLPYTKLAHIFYRTLAMVYARSVGRL